MAKRCYIPVIIRENCPECGHEAVVDFSGDGHYLSYPSPNEPFHYDFYCGECSHDWESKEKIVLVVRLEFLKDTIDKACGGPTRDLQGDIKLMIEQATQERKDELNKPYVSDGCVWLRNGDYSMELSKINDPEKLNSWIQELHNEEWFRPRVVPKIIELVLGYTVKC